MEGLLHCRDYLVQRTATKLAVHRRGEGAGVIVMNGQISRQDKLVRVTRNPDLKAHMVCLYNYRCLADGRLTFVESSPDVLVSSVEPRGLQQSGVRD